MNSSDSEHEQQQQQQPEPSFVLANTPITPTHPTASGQGPEVVEVGRKRKFGEYKDEDQNEGGDEDGDGDTDTETIGSDGEPGNGEGSAIVNPGGAHSRSSHSTPPSKRQHPDSDGHDHSLQRPSSHDSDPDIRALPAQHSSMTSSPFTYPPLSSSPANANPVDASEAHTLRSITTTRSEGVRPSMLQHHADMWTIGAVVPTADEVEDAYSDADRRENTSPVEEITTEGARGLSGASTGLPRANAGAGTYTSTFTHFHDGPRPSTFSGPRPSAFTGSGAPRSNGNGNGNGGNDFFLNFFASQMRANRAASEASHAFLHSFLNPHPHSQNSGFRYASRSGTNFSAAPGPGQPGVNSFTAASVPVTPIVLPNQSVPVAHTQPFSARHTLPLPLAPPLPQTLPFQTPPQPVYTRAYGHAIPTLTSLPTSTNNSSFNPLPPRLLPLQTPPPTVFTPAYSHATSTPIFLPTSTTNSSNSLRSIPPVGYTLPTRVTRTLNQNINSGGAPGLAGFHAPSYGY